MAKSNVGKSLSNEIEKEEVHPERTAQTVALFGHAAWLMMHAETHKNLRLSDLLWACEPPILLEQCYFWHHDQKPVGFASWACLSEESEQRVMLGTQGVRSLTAADWNSGDQLWLMDLILPFGGRERAEAELREKFFKDKRVKALKPRSDGKGMEVVDW